jgi:para-nitrobenzyl esterase
MAASGDRDEDCLYLNVYTPAAVGGSRSVLFWVHGGGYTLGAGSELVYHGGPLAERGDVVVVSINYRLGALGFLFLGEHGGDGWGATANSGQLDMIAGLQWVRENIHAFGGDRDNVTIFGEPAGASAVATLLAMPVAKGLFHKAILQSGTANGLSGREGGAELAEFFLKQLGAGNDQSALQTASADAIVDAQARAIGEMRLGARGFAPVVEGETLPEVPLQAIRNGFAADIPMVIGSNRDEAKLFNAGARDRAPIDDLKAVVGESLPPAHRGAAEELIETYRASRTELGLPTSNHDLLDAIQSDVRFTGPVALFSAAQRQHQPNTFVYLFTHESPARRGALGACHALEMPFVFGTLDAPTQDRFTGSGPEVELLSANMMQAWIEFAKTGNPSHEGIGDWAPYDAGPRPTMIFDKASRMVDAPFLSERIAIEAVLWAVSLDRRGTHP